MGRMGGNGITGGAGEATTRNHSTIPTMAAKNDKNSTRGNSPTSGAVILFRVGFSLKTCVAIICRQGRGGAW